MTKIKVSYDLIGKFNSKIIVDQSKVNNSPLIGIEVTDSEIQRELFINIDPQHTEKISNSSAIKSIDQNFQLYIDKIIAAGSASVKLLTSKADLDSIGGMVLLNSALNGENEAFTSAEVKERINNIHIFDNDPTNGVKPKNKSEALKFLESSNLAAIRQAINDPNRNISLENKCSIMKEWLLTGNFTGQHIYLKKYEENKALLNDDKVTILPQGTIKIETHSDLALMYGYIYGDVVIAIDKEYFDPKTQAIRTKHTIAVNPESKTIYPMQEFIDEINSIEKNGKWGGSSTIAGDPQEKGSSINSDDIARLVDKFNRIKEQEMPTGLGINNLAETLKNINIVR